MTCFSLFKISSPFIWLKIQRQRNLQRIFLNSPISVLLNPIFRGNNLRHYPNYTIYWPLELHAGVYCEGLAAGVGGAEARDEPAPVEDLLPHAELLSAGRLPVRASNEGCRKITRSFAITKKAPTRAFSLLKAPTSASITKNILRHYGEWAWKHFK